MRREDKKKLIINRRIIVTHLNDLESVLDYLITKQVFVPAARSRINQTMIKSDRIRQMLDHLIDCKPQAFQYFLEALVLTGHASIADQLEPNYTASDDCKNLIELERLTHASHVASANQNSTNPLLFNLNDHQLPYPVVCTQQHSVDAGANPLLLATTSANTPVHHVKRLLRNNGLPPKSASHMNRLTFCSNTSETSRSNSASMSPVINRSRSSSVNALVKSFNGYSLDETKQIATTTSRNSGYISAEECLSPTPALSTPAAYNNIEWSHVNSLELDFPVYQSLPNSYYKQLSPNECYQMEQLPRGLCLIINNETFEENGQRLDELRRVGTAMDASRLKNLFEKLAFRVQVHVDLRECEMRQVFGQLANEANVIADRLDAICLIVLTHGSDGYLHGVDLENKINIDSVLNMFDDVLCGKPKLFIFQACRGEYLNLKFSCGNETNVQSTKATVSSVTCLRVEEENGGEVVSKCSVIEQTSSEIEETVKSFKQIKLSSSSPANNASSSTTTSSTSTHQSCKQFMFKKKDACNKPINTVSSETASQETNNKASSKKSRSRSHSRGKYTSYLASAANAIITALKTSPNATKTLLSNIATQTTNDAQPTPPQSSQQQSQPSTSVSASSSSTSAISCGLSMLQNSSSGIWHKDSNIYMSTSYNSNQSIMNFIDGRPIKTSLPSRSDFFIWYSSVRGFVSHRDVDGSPFIKCLVTVFSRCSYELELCEMVRKVNLLMQQYEKRHFDTPNSTASYFMVPVAELHLTKRLYFNP